MAGGPHVAVNLKEQGYGLSAVEHPLHYHLVGGGQLLSQHSDGKVIGHLGNLQAAIVPVVVVAAVVQDVVGIELHLVPLWGQ